MKIYTEFVSVRNFATEISDKVSKSRASSIISSILEI